MTDPDSSPAPAPGTDAATAGAHRRTTAVLITGVSAGSTGIIAALTVSTLVAEGLIGEATWSGLPVAASVLGTAVGSSLLVEAIGRWGRRRGLPLGYAIGAIGAGLALTAAVRSSFTLLIGGLFVLGFGHSVNMITRYVVADLSHPARRARAVGLVVWAGTIGAVVGPNLLSPSGRLASRLGLPELGGAYFVAMILYTAAGLLYLALLRPPPPVLETPDGRVGRRGTGLAELFRLRRVQVAVATLVGGQTVMVLIMTMTPLHLQGLGHHLGTIGSVMSAHVIGMFALSPVTGRLTDRHGAGRIIVASQATLLLAAVGAAATPPESVGGTMAALFLLGYGWNLGFVGGSTILSSQIPSSLRTRLQGRVDTLVWISAATASVGSSLVLARAGYLGVCVLGASLVLVTSAVLVLRRPRLEAA